MSHFEAIIVLSMHMTHRKLQPQAILNQRGNALILQTQPALITPTASTTPTTDPKPDRRAEVGTSQNQTKTQPVPEDSEPWFWRFILPSIPFVLLLGFRAGERGVSLGV